MTKSIPLMHGSSAKVDLYAEFGIDATASVDDIKRAYRKLALKFHPDKLISLQSQEERDAATERFQRIVTYYGILSDPVKRKRYDTTGSLDDALTKMEEFGCGEGGDWNAYFRELWSGVVSSETIEEFKTKYIGSEEERTDIIDAYTEFKGDMNKIMENVPLSTVGDEDRFRSIVNDAINTKQVKKFKLFETSNSDKDRNRRKREAEREAQEAEALAQELGLNHKKSKTSNQTETAEEEDQLKALIQSRQSSRMQGMLASLEEKYGGGGGKKGAKKGKGVEAAAPDLGPTDEEFEAIQAKLLKKNKVSVGKGKSKK